MPTLYSIIESPVHPNLSPLYERLGLKEQKFSSMRKALAQLKQQAPDVVIADFIYGYGNNYAGVNISNLDVFLYSLQRYAPQTKVVVLVEKTERQYVDKLNSIIPLHAIMVYPVDETALARILTS
ncbi:MAG: hypothetical protein HY080_14755 [Gammaproteobacteria bacterium]|nr:hypothetical protein [Gammaproteobacteria bacterium]